MKHHDKKQLVEETVYFTLHSQVTVTCWGKSGAELSAGAEAEPYRNALHWYAQPAFLYIDHGSIDGIASSGLSPPTSIINQENFPQVNLVR